MQSAGGADAAMNDVGTPSKSSSYRFYNRPRHAPSRQQFAVAVCVLCFVGALVLFAASGRATPLLIGTLDFVRGLGPLGVPVLILCECVAFLALLPISPLHVGMGFLYGPVAGMAVAWVAYTVGCVPPYLAARVPFVASRFGRLRRDTMLDDVMGALEQEPFKLIVCLRLLPFMPSPLNSYALGLSDVPVRTYAAASFVGCFPNTLAYVYLGTLLDSLADIAAGRHVGRSPVTYAMLGVGVLAAVALLAYVSRVAARRVATAREAAIRKRDSGFSPDVPDLAREDDRLLPA